MKHLRKISIVAFLSVAIFVFFTPQISYAAASNLIWECGTGDGNCTWDGDVIPAVKNATNYLTALGIGFSVAVLAYAGFRLMISQGNQGEITKAKEMMYKVVIGMFFIVAAWAIVTLVLSGLGVTTVTFSPK